MKRVIEHNSLIVPHFLNNNLLTSWDWLAIKQMIMEQILMSMLKKQGYDLIGIVDGDKNIWGYAKDNVYHFCNGNLEEIDREKLGIKDKIVALSIFDNVITILEDGIDFNFQKCVFINQNNEIIDHYYNKGDSYILFFSRINSESVYLYSDIDSRYFCFDFDNESRLYRANNENCIGDFAIIDGVVCPHCDSIKIKKLKDNYYLLQDREKCRIYNSHNGVVFEDANFFIWSHDNQIHLLDGKSTDDGYNISLLSLDGEELAAYNVHKYILGNECKSFWVNINHYYCSPRCFANDIIVPLNNIGFFLIRYNDDYINEGKYIPIYWKSDSNYNLYNHLISVDYNNDISIYDYDGNRIVDEFSNRIVINMEPFGKYVGKMYKRECEVLIPPIFQEIRAISEYVYEATLPLKMGDCENVKGLLTNDGELIIPFGLKYYFANYYFVIDHEIISSKSDTYIIYKEGRYKGLIYKYKKVLDAKYDKINYLKFRLNYSKEPSEKLKKIFKQQLDCVFLNKDGKWGYFIDEECFLEPCYSYIEWFTMRGGYHYFIGGGDKEHGGVFLFSENKDFNLRNPSKNERFDSVSLVRNSDFFSVYRDNCVGLVGLVYDRIVYIPPTYHKILILYNSFIADNVIRNFENEPIFDLKDEFSYISRFYDDIYAIKNINTGKYAFVDYGGDLLNAEEQEDGTFQITSDLFFNPEKKEFYRDDDDDQEPIYDTVDDTNYEEDTYYALGGDDYQRFKENGGSIDDMMDALGF